MNPSLDDDLGIEYFDDILLTQNKKKPSLLEQAPRQIARVASRSAETLLGLPGDLVQSIRSLAQALPGGLQPEEEQNFLQRGLRSAAESLPTSSEFRARTAEARPELEPQSEYEEIADEFTQDVASLALPIKGKIPFARALGISAIGNLGKQTAKAFGFEEGTQDATKLGLMVFSSMFGSGRGVNSYINNLYREAEQFVPEGAKLSYSPKSIAKYESMISKGAINDAKAPALDILEQIKTKSAQGTMNVVDAVEFDRNINRAISQASRAGDKSRKGWLDQLKKVNAKALEGYADENPSWGENWKAAKQAYQGIATSENVKDYVKRNANLKNLSHAAILLGIGEAAFPGHVLEKLGATAASAGSIMTGQVAKRIATNPALRRYYENVVSAALNENKAMLTRNLQGLERAAKKEFEKNPFPLVEFEEEIED